MIHQWVKSACQRWFGLFGGEADVGRRRPQRNVLAGDGAVGTKFEKPQLRWLFCGFSSSTSICHPKCPLNRHESENPRPDRRRHHRVDSAGCLTMSERSAPTDRRSNCVNVLAHELEGGRNLCVWRERSLGCLELGRAGRFTAYTLETPHKPAGAPRTHHTWSPSFVPAQCSMAR